MNHLLKYLFNLLLKYLIFNFFTKNIDINKCKNNTLISGEKHKTKSLNI